MFCSITLRSFERSSTMIHSNNTRHLLEQKPINITGTDEINLYCNSIHVSIVNDVREPILYCLGRKKSPGHEIFNKPTIKTLKMLNLSVLFHESFYLEEDDYNAVVLMEKRYVLLVT